MNALYTVAYPRLDDADREFVDRIRARHDALAHSRIRAHFTLLFACDVVPEQQYLAHVSGIASDTPGIEFACRYAQAVPVAADRKTYVFLVPDEGFAAISRLHDALYSGILAPSLRPEPSFTPHMTLASVDSNAEAREIAATLNAQGLAVRGRIAELHVGTVAGDKFVHHGSCRLRH